MVSSIDPFRSAPWYSTNPERMLGAWPRITFHITDALPAPVTPTVRSGDAQIQPERGAGLCAANQNRVDRAAIRDRVRTSEVDYAGQRVGVRPHQLATRPSIVRHHTQRPRVHGSAETISRGLHVRDGLASHQGHGRDEVAVPVPPQSVKAWRLTIRGAARPIRRHEPARIHQRGPQMLHATLDPTAPQRFRDEPGERGRPEPAPSSQAKHAADHQPEGGEVDADCPRQEPNAGQTE